ncbi:MAG: putative rane protein [Myxococcaceae bacterium]|nr:putative rane protein [Myxococcaceae bacterium]
MPHPRSSNVTSAFSRSSLPSHVFRETPRSRALGRRAVDAPQLRRRISMPPDSPRLLEDTPATTALTDTQDRSAETRREHDQSGIVPLVRRSAAELAARTSTTVHSSPEPRAEGVDYTTGALLGAIAGAVDAAGWLCLAGLLPSHLTASLVILGASFGEYESSEVSARLAMIPAFILSVALVKAIAGWLSARKLPVLAPLLALLTLALTVFCIAGSLCDVLLVDHPRVLLGVGGIGVASMAVQNTIMRLCLPRQNPTTVMTGNLTQFVISSVDLAMRGLRAHKAGELGAPAQAELWTRLKSAAVPLLGFVAGSVASGYLASVFGLRCLAFPLALSGITTLLACRRLQQERLVARALSDRPDDCSRTGPTPAAQAPGSLRASGPSTPKSVHPSDAPQSARVVSRRLLSC